MAQWGGVSSVKAEELYGEVKTKLLLLKNGAINSTNFDITPIAPSTLTTENLYAATFTTKSSGYHNAFKYESLDVSDYDKAVVKYTIEEGNGEWHINLPNNNHISLPLGVDQEYEVDLRDVDTYGDFTVFSWNHTGKSITISEVYLYKEPSKLSLIKDHDYSTDDKYPWYRVGPAEGSDASFDVEDGALVISNPKVQTNNYDVQPFILDGITLKEGHNYLVRIKMKASENDGSANIVMGTWGSSMNQTLNFAAGNEIVDYNLEFNNSTVESTGDIHILFQCGSYIGTVTISKVEVYEIVPSDPLKIYKEKLQAAIDKGNAQNSFAKTTDSWTTLTSAVGAGETALSNALADPESESEESLTTATNNINNSSFSSS